MFTMLKKNRKGCDERKITGEIDFSELVEILVKPDDRHLGNKNIKYDISARREFYTELPAEQESETPRISYDNEAHEKWVRHKFKEKEIEESIEFAEKGLILKNLKIRSTPIEGRAYVLTSNLSLEFQNCQFVANEDAKEENNAVEINLGVPTPTSIYIRNCQIKDSIFYVTGFTGTHEGVSSSLIIENNHFINSNTLISNRNSTVEAIEYKKTGFGLSGYRANPKKHQMAKDMSKNFNEDLPFDKEFYSTKFENREAGYKITLSDIMRFLRLQHKLINLTPDDIELEKTYGEIKVANNNFDEVRISGGGNIRIAGGNTANIISLSGDNLYLSPHNDIAMDAKHAMNHREKFIALQKIAKDKNDAFQEQVFKREVIKCERLIHKQETASINLQDRVVLWWGEFSSLHGISWVRPIALITILNIICAIPLAYLFNDFSFAKIVSVWVDLFNPTKFVDKEGAILTIVIFQKIFFALLVYETIRAARRFAR